MKDIIAYRVTFKYLCFAFSILEPPESNLIRKSRAHVKSLVRHADKSFFILKIKKWSMMNRKEM